MDCVRECHYPHSADPWRPESAEGTVEAEDGGEALEKIIHGLGVPLEDSIPWDLISLDREVVITIKPVAEPPSAPQVTACPVCDKVLETVRVSGGSALFCPRCQRIIPPGELERARAIKRLTEGAMDVVDQAVSEGRLPG